MYKTTWLNRHNAHFEVPNLERELIQTHYRIPLPGEVCTFITVAKILERINAGIRQPLSPVKTGLALKELGFEPVRINHQRGYRVVERTLDEIRLSAQSLARDTETPVDQGTTAKNDDQFQLPF